LYSSRGVPEDTGLKQSRKRLRRCLKISAVVDHTQKGLPLFTILEKKELKSRNEVSVTEKRAVEGVLHTI
jgi:hypothetical protein